ncbi:hypothetical protein GCM10025787_38600 [Saccharopolyspora rosea]
MPVEVVGVELDARDVRRTGRAQCRHLRVEVAGPARGEHDAAVAAPDQPFRDGRADLAATTQDEYGSAHHNKSATGASRSCSQAGAPADLLSTMD